MMCTCLRYGFISHLSSTYYLKDNRGQERGVVDMDFLGYGFFAVVSRNEWDPVEIRSPKQLYIITSNPRHCIVVLMSKPHAFSPGAWRKWNKTRIYFGDHSSFYSQGICTTSHQYPLYLPLHWAIISLLRPNFFAKNGGPSKEVLLHLEINMDHSDKIQYKRRKISSRWEII